jgi:hypothetical protein
MAAAYTTGEGLRRHFEDVAAGASGAARVARPGRVRFQGHVLEVRDLLAMWDVEFTLHHLDLVAHLGDRGLPGREALEITSATIEGLIGSPRPSCWDLVTYVQKAAGRRPLERQERARLEDVARRYPVSG